MVFTAALAAAAAGGVFFWTRSRPRPAAPAAPPAAAVRPAEPELVFAATIRAQNVVPVSVPVPGTIESLAAEIGEQVYQGQILGRISNTSLGLEEQTAAAELERAQTRFTQLQDQMIAARLEASRTRADAARVQAEFDRAEKAFLRQQMLVREGATPRLVYEKAAREYEAAKTTHDAVESIVRSAEDRLNALIKSVDAARAVVDEKTRALEDARAHSAAAEIRSPVNGMVVGRTHATGDEVSPEVKDLFQIATDLYALEAVIHPDPGALRRLRTGQQATIALADAAEIIPASIDEIRGGETILHFNAPDPAIRPGLAAQVRVAVK